MFGLQIRREKKGREREKNECFPSKSFYFRRDCINKICLCFPLNPYLPNPSPPFLLSKQWIFNHSKSFPFLFLHFSLSKHSVNLESMTSKEFGGLSRSLITIVSCHSASWLVSQCPMNCNQPHARSFEIP